VVETRPGWLYLYSPEGDGVYAWAHADAPELVAPHAGRAYAVRSLDDDRRGTVSGRDLLLVPEVLGVRAPAPDVVDIETEGPVPYFLDLTLHGALRPTPREAVSRRPRDWVRPEHIVTSGPFHLHDWRMRDRIELVRSPTFWGRDGVRLDRLTFYSMGNQAAIVNVYYQGGCDAVMSNTIPNSMLRVVAGRKDHVRAPMLSVYTYVINTRRFPSAHFRRALSAALDRAELAALLKGGQIPTEAYVPGRPIAELGDDELEKCHVARADPGVALFVAPSLCYVPPREIGFDPTAAAAEMALARAELGDRFPRALTIKINGGVEQHKTIAEWAQRKWEQAFGLDVRIEAQEWNTFLAATTSHDFDVARVTWQGNFPDPEGEFLNIFKCRSPDNRGLYCNPTFDALIADAERIADRAERLRVVRRAEEAMIADAPVIPLYVYTQHVLVKPYVRGLAVNPTDHQSFRDVAIAP
jgi:ABC-type oligopeptide transport system substrate-binding subunit